MINLTQFNNCSNQTSFNQFSNLDSIEERIIDYIKNSNTPEAQRIWKLLKYPDMKALYQSDLSQEDKSKLIYKDDNQMDKRIFDFKYIEDSFSDTCSLIKVYVSRIKPQNHLISVVDISFEILSHNKLTNVYNDSSDIYESGRPVEESISVKNRNTVILRSLLALLNGANIEGVGKLQFNSELSDKSQVEGNLSNNKNYYGYTLTMSCLMSGVGGAYCG